MNLDELQSKKYISVETYKKSGEAIQTPVWFFIANGQVHVVTRSKTGKIKRLRNSPKVRIAECTIRGKIIGRWKSGTATILDSTQTKEMVGIRDKKYGFAARVAKFFTSGKGELVVFSVSLDGMDAA